MTTAGASPVERPVIGKMIEGEVARRMDTVRSIRFPSTVPGQHVGFSPEQHLGIAQAQLLEILQYGAPGRPLDLDQVYDHFVIAVSHLGVARDGLGEWHNALARWEWTNASDPLVSDPPTSRELYNAARERGETVGDEWAKRGENG